MGDLVFEHVVTDAQVESWREVHNRVIPTVALTTEEVRERATRNHLELALVDDVLVGNSTVWPPTDDTKTARVIVRVLPEHRHRGYGSQLYERAITVAARMGAERLGTVVLASNTDGYRFARHHGFVKTEDYVLPGQTIPWIELERPSPDDRTRGAGPVPLVRAQ